MKKRIVIIVVVVAAIFAGLAYSEGWFSRDSSLQGSGTVEARDIRVGSKVGGRIDKIFVREGDTVKAGQVLITFDDKELAAALDQSKAAAEKAARGYRPEEIAEAKAAVDAAKAEYEQRKNGYRSEDIAAAQADLERAKADAARAKLDYDRYEALSQKDLVSKQQSDGAEATWRMSDAAQANAQHKLDELQVMAIGRKRLLRRRRDTSRRKRRMQNLRAGIGVRMSIWRRLRFLMTKRDFASAKLLRRRIRPSRCSTCGREI